MRDFPTKEKVDAQSRKDPRAPFAVDGGGPAFSALVRQNAIEFQDRI